MHDHLTRPPSHLDDPLVFLRRDLLGAGWTDRSIRTAVGAGRLTRIRHGSFVDTPSWSALDAVGRHRLLARAVLARAGCSAVLSHSSALAMWGCPDWGLDLQTVDLTRLDQRPGRVEAGVRQHRGAVEAGDVVDLDGTLVMAPGRAALETATTAGVEAGTVQVNDLLRRGLATAEELARRYDDEMVRWPGALRAGLVLRLAESRCESVAESRFLHLCWRAGIPRPVPQLELVDADGRTWARLDFAWPALGVFAEVDGRVKYTDPHRVSTITQVVLREKEREDRVREETGWRCIRVGWADLERPDPTARRLRRLLFPDSPIDHRAA